MSSGHARLGPSNHRWPHCPGSVREEAAYPDSAGDAAIDGTGSHLLLELILQQDSGIGRASEWIDRTIGEGHHDRSQGWWVKQDRADRVQMCLDYIIRRQNELGAVVIEAETKSDPGKYFGRDDWYGTGDVTIRSDTVLEIIDYKDGRGYVSEKNNSQFEAYGGGRLAELMMTPNGMDFFSSRIQTVRLTVVQPKTSKPIRYVEMTPVELWEKVTELAAAAALTDDPLAPLIDGDHCQWCKHGRAGNCTAKTQKAMEGITSMTSTEGAGNTSIIDAIQSGQIAPGTMTDVQLADIKDVAPLITAMLKQVDDELKSRLVAGTYTAGRYAMVPGRNSNKWIDEPDIVEKKLKGMRFKKDTIFPASLISPAQALKQDGLTERQKANLEKMIDSVPGADTVKKSNTVAKESAEMMFMGTATAVPSAPSFM